MVTSDPLPDYYAILQVQPTADQEVIEAAYRQLMKKHHPDLAGGDPQAVADKHRRATEINRAFAVLRDPNGRRQYDLMRQFVGTRRPAPRPQGPPAPPPPRPAPPPPPAEREEIVLPPEPATLPAPLSWLVSAYFLLPGKYEWERGAGRELLTILLIPVVGTLAFALATGRLAGLIGHSPGTTVSAALLVGLLALPLLPSLPRVLTAGGPGLILLTGVLTPSLTQAHIPVWLAWAASALFALLLSARLYVFGFLPTLLLCWLLSHA